jgi:tetraacyldisaccharide 4'-kinase
LISHNFIKRHLLKRSFLSDVLTPLSKLNAVYQIFRRKRASENQWHPERGIISIGNISSGGSGKTPFCIFLAKLLDNEGLKIGISHRGYKGSFENTPTMISEGRGPVYGPLEAGDEAYLLARRLPKIPVVVGKKRIAAVSLLLAAFPDTKIVILDDAFQHLHIARDLDIVCFDSSIGIGNGRVIPAGYLREPLDAISEETVVIINHKDAAAADDSLENLLSKRTEHIFYCHYKTQGLYDPRGNCLPASELSGKRVILISGIADPSSFEGTLREAGISWIHHFKYPDHHDFGDAKEIEKIATLCEKYKAEYLVCTEKDLAKLSVHGRIKDLLLGLRIKLSCPEAEELKKLVLDRVKTR